MISFLINYRSGGGVGIYSVRMLRLNKIKGGKIG